MSQFFTQCPYCQTSFKIGESQLEAADGLVRCGACLDVFSALEFQVTLKENSPIEDENITPLEEAEETDKEKNEIEAEQSGSEKKPPPIRPYKTTSKIELHENLSQLSDEGSLEPLQPETLEAIDIDPLEISTGKPRRSSLMTSFLLLCNVIFVLVLAGQYVWHNVEALRENPRLTASTNLLCRYIVCPEQEMVDLSQLYTEELIIRSHPSTQNALLVDFILSNRASFEQNFPLAELSFTDTNNRLLANRQFTPQEYLPPELVNFARMPSNSSIQVSLEIVDPGERAVNYSLDFK